jgi:hydrogenase-4 transcriptional activator
MRQFVHVLLKVWREVSRCHDPDELIRTLAGLITARVPAEVIALQRVDIAQTRVDVLGEWIGSEASAGPPRRVSLREHDLQLVLGWLSEEGAIRLDGAVRSALWPGWEGDMLGVGLGDERGREGVLLLGSRRGDVFDANHAELACALREPLTVAVRNRRQREEVSALREAAEADRTSLLRRLGREDLTTPIVGAETGLKHVLERVEMVTGTDLPVLILGESGSGKEVVARAIHDRSPRRDGPFLRVNCGAIPPELVDSELFGHEKGSFTGATAARKGWFERAHSGTLFLDEIGELPGPAQVRLLRVLQDGSYERVGGQQTRSCDVRMVAATHRDLRSMASRGEFRQDLWFRIAVFPIELPAMRDRPEDIPALAEHFARRAARRFGFRALPVASEQVRLLLGYAWPGNVRELAAVMDRAVILGQGERLAIEPALGMPTLGQGGGVQRAGPSDGGDAVGPVRAEGEAVAVDGVAAPAASDLDGAMRSHIEGVLERTHGRIEGPFGAAKVLGVNPHTLRSRMRRLGIDWARFRQRGN